MNGIVLVASAHTILYAATSSVHVDLDRVRPHKLVRLGEKGSIDGRQVAKLASIRQGTQDALRFALVLLLQHQTIHDLDGVLVQCSTESMEGFLLEAADEVVLVLAVIVDPPHERHLGTQAPGRSPIAEARGGRFHSAVTPPPWSHCR